MVSERLTPVSYFYPRPPRGGRLSPIRQQRQPERFLSTPSARRATLMAVMAVLKVLFLSTPSARRATHRGRQGTPVPPISIHALREEGDRAQSHPRPHRRYFYPRPPRGGRRAEVCGADRRICISIHALREEGDGFFYVKKRGKMLFLSTPSARRATVVDGDCPRDVPISIHALREEGDVVLIVCFRPFGPFLSTPSARRATVTKL